MTSHCAVLGVSVPPTFPAESDHALALPFLTKPRLGCGGCGITRVATQAEAAEMRDLARARPGTLLAQEELQGELLHVGGVAKNGNLLQAAVYGDPHHEHSNFGPVSSIVIVDAPEIISAAAKVIDSLGLTGAFCFDYIRVADGRPMLLDVNARVFGSWLPLQQAGLDLVGSYMFAWGLSDVEPNGRIAAGSRLSVVHPFSRNELPPLEAALAIRGALWAGRTLGLRWTISALLTLLTGAALHGWNGLARRMASKDRRPRKPLEHDVY